MLNLIGAVQWASLISALGDTSGEVALQLLGNIKQYEIAILSAEFLAVAVVWSFHWLKHKHGAKAIKMTDIDNHPGSSDPHTQNDIPNREAVRDALHQIGSDQRYHLAPDRQRRRWPFI